MSYGLIKYGLDPYGIGAAVSSGGALTPSITEAASAAEASSCVIGYASARTESGAAGDTATATLSASARLTAATAT